MPTRPPGRLYTVQATIGGQRMAEVPDPYVHAVGLNGERGALLDPATASPTRSSSEKCTCATSPCTMPPQFGVGHKGKFLGVAETGTRSPGGVRTGLDHLTELGLNHVHLLPTNDFAFVDESRLTDNRYNWGYAPLYYSVPEGSYATDPADPASRIREQELMRTLHANELRLVLDVVYNHTANAARSSFEQLVPGY